MRSESADTAPDGLVLLAPAVHGDARGFFIETFRADAWAAAGVPTEFVQDNHSRSRRGTLRGMHFQTDPGQGKLVRVARGRVLDVVVDLRRGSPTFGEWEGVELDDEHGPPALHPRRLRPRLLRALRDRRLRLQVHRATTTRRPRAGSASTIPTSASSGRGDVELLYSERDRDAPRLAEVADSLPFRYDG